MHWLPVEDTVPLICDFFVHLVLYGGAYVMLIDGSVWCIVCDESVWDRCDQWDILFLHWSQQFDWTTFEPSDFLKEDCFDLK